MIQVVILFVVILFIHSFFSLVEAAVLAVNGNKLKMLAESGDNKAIELNQYLQNKTRILSTSRVGSSFAVLFCGVVCAGAFAKPLSQYFLEQGWFVFYGNASFWAAVIIILVLTYFVVVFGEMVPKRIGIKNAESVVYRTMGIMKILGVLLRPFTFIFILSANCFARFLGVSSSEVDDNITEEEIRMMVDAGGDSGSIDESEKEMINNIFEFDNTMVGDIATHRTDIVALEIHSTLKEVLEIINEEKYSRIPVYEENIDNIVGVFHVKDIVKYVLNDTKDLEDQNFDIRPLLMKPYFVPFSKKTDELFEEMQKNKVYMSIVIDEYGGTAGLVTMEDLLEEIVGNIFDEYDDVEEEIKVLDNHTYLMQGTTLLKDVEEFLEVEFAQSEDYDTLGGFLIGQLGRIPNDLEQPEITVDHFVFHIEKIVDKRIELVKVKHI